MAKRFSKKYGNKGLPQEQAKTDILSEVSIQVMCIVEEGVANACI